MISSVFAMCRSPGDTVKLNWILARRISARMGPRARRRQISRTTTARVNWDSQADSATRTSMSVGDIWIHARMGPHVRIRMEATNVSVLKGTRDAIASRILTTVPRIRVWMEGLVWMASVDINVSVWMDSEATSVRRTSTSATRIPVWIGLHARITSIRIHAHVNLDTRPPTASWMMKIAPRALAWTVKRVWMDWILINVSVNHYGRDRIVNWGSMIANQILVPMVVHVCLMAWFHLLHHVDTRVTALVARRGLDATLELTIVRHWSLVLIAEPAEQPWMDGDTNVLMVGRVTSLAISAKLSAAECEDSREGIRFVII